MHDPTSALRLAREDGRRQPRKILFTIAALKAIRPPTAGRTTLYDTKARGLAFTVTAKGAASFYLVKWLVDQRKAARIRIGAWPDVSIEQARTQAAKLNGAIAEGQDPRAEKRAIRQSSTLGEVWEKYAEEAKLRMKPSTRVTDASRWKKCLQRWENRKLLEIRPQDVKDLHAELGKERGRINANRAVQLLRRMLKWAGVNPNPAGEGVVDFFAETERDRYATADDLVKLFAALDAEANQDLADFFRMCLWTAARRGNVAAMEWREIDLKAKTWTVPAAKLKTAKPLVVPLVTPAVDILKQRKADQDQKRAKAIEDREARPEDPPCPWVFPGRGRSGHLVEPKTAWQRITAAAGLKDLHIHDLRHTMASWMAGLGVGLPIVGKMLGHRRAETTQRYSHIEVAPARTAAAAASAAMLAAVEEAKAELEKKAKGQQAKSDKQDDGRQSP